MATKAVIKKIDTELVEECCGKKYTHGNGTKRCQRAGTAKRHPCASIGQLDLTLHRVKVWSGKK